VPALIRWILRVLNHVFSALVGLVIVFEEWGWEPLQRALAWVGRWPGLRWIERWVSQRPPYGALALFALPTLALLPVKLAALWLIGHGKVLAGAAVIATAKLVGTAVMARLYTLTQPALMQLAWFARLHARWTVWKAALLEHVRASWPWRYGRALKRHWRRRWAAWRGQST
jgi:hypothetical protein